MGDSSDSSGRSGGDLCELCEKVIGRIACDACDMEALCDTCDNDLHKTGKRHAHKRVYVDSGETLPPIPADPSALAVTTDDADATHAANAFGALSLLSPGNSALARPRASINLLARPGGMFPRGSVAIGGLGSIQEHRHAIPSPSPSPAAAAHSPAEQLSTVDESPSEEQFVKMCDACGSSRAAWYCSSCQRFACAECDHSTHKSSSMKNHQRAPYPPVFGKAAAAHQTHSEDAATPSNGSGAPSLVIHPDSSAPSPIGTPQMVTSQAMTFGSPLTSPFASGGGARGQISPALLALSTGVRTATPGGGRNSRAMSVMAPAGGARSSLSPLIPARSVAPTPTSTAAGGARLSTIHNVLCDICEDSKASVFCPECDMHLCISNQCDEQLHAPKKMSGHVRNPINTLSFAAPAPAPALTPAAASPAAPTPTVAAPVAAPSPASSAAPIAAAPAPAPTPAAAAAPRATLSVHPFPMLNRSPVAAASPSPTPTAMPVLSPQQMRPRSSSVMMKNLPLAKPAAAPEPSSGLGLIQAETRPATALPAAPSTARTARGTRLCDICDQHAAAVYCAACPMYLCVAGGCDGQLHAPAKMAHHFRSAIPKAVCTICEENVGDVWCFDCRQHYCTIDGCDEGFHRPFKMASHRRQPVAQLHPPNKPHTPKEQAPKAQTPKAFSQKAQTPTAQTPKAQTPKSFSPKAHTPQAHPPKAQTPKAATPKAPTPKGHKPKLSVFDFAGATDKLEIVVASPSPVAQVMPATPAVMTAPTNLLSTRTTQPSLPAVAAALPATTPHAIPHSSPSPVPALAVLSALSSPSTASFFVVCDACDTALATLTCDACREVDPSSPTTVHFYCASCDESAHSQQSAAHLHTRRPITKADLRPTPSSEGALNGPSSSHLGLTNSLLPLTAITGRHAATSRSNAYTNRTNRSLPPSSSPEHTARPSTLLSSQLPVATARAPAFPTQVVAQLPTCDRCSKAKADLHCEDCELNLDTACFHQLHKSSSAKLHPRKMLVPAADGLAPTLTPTTATGQTARQASTGRQRDSARLPKPSSKPTSPLNASRSPVPPLDFTSGRLVLGGPLHPSALLPASSFGDGASSSSSTTSSRSHSPSATTRSKAKASARVKAKSSSEAVATGVDILEDEFAIESLLTDEEEEAKRAAKKASKRHKKQRTESPTPAPAVAAVATEPVVPKLALGANSTGTLESIQSALLSRVSTLERDLQESVQLKSARIHSARQQAAASGRSLSRVGSIIQPGLARKPSEPSRPRPSLIAISGFGGGSPNGGHPPSSVDDTPAAMAAIRRELLEARSQLQQFQSLTQTLTLQLQQQQQAVSLIQQQQQQQRLAVSSLSPLPPLFSSPVSSGGVGVSSGSPSLSMPFQQELAQLISHTIQATLHSTAANANENTAERRDSVLTEASESSSDAPIAKKKQPKKRPVTATLAVSDLSTPGSKPSSRARTPTRTRVQSAAAARLDARASHERRSSPNRRPVGTLFHKPVQTHSHRSEHKRGMRGDSCDSASSSNQTSASATPRDARGGGAMGDSSDTDWSAFDERHRHAAVSRSRSRARTPEPESEQPHSASLTKRTPHESSISLGPLRRTAHGQHLLPTQTTPSATPSRLSTQRVSSTSLANSRRSTLDVSAQPIVIPGGASSHAHKKARSSSKPRTREENDAVVFLAPSKRDPRARPHSAFHLADLPSVPPEVDSHRMSDEEEEVSDEDERDGDDALDPVSSSRSISSATTSLIARYREEAVAAMSSAGNSFPARAARTMPLDLDAIAAGPGVGQPLTSSSSAAQVGGVSAAKRRARELRRQVELAQQLTIERQLRVTDHRRIAQLHAQLHRLQQHIEYQQTQAESAWLQEHDTKAARERLQQEQMQLSREREEERTAAAAAAALEKEQEEVRHRARLIQQEYDAHRYSAAPASLGRLQASASVPSLASGFDASRKSRSDATPHSLSKLAQAQSFADSIRGPLEEERKEAPFSNGGGMPPHGDDGHSSPVPFHQPVSLASLPPTDNRATFARDILLASSLLQEHAVDGNVRGGHARSSTSTSALAAAAMALGVRSPSSASPSPSSASGHRNTPSFGREADAWVKPSRARRMERDRLARHAMHQRAFSTGNLHGASPAHAATRSSPVDPTPTRQLFTHA